MVGYFRQALKCSDRMIRLEPLAALGYERRGSSLIAMGRNVEAHETWQKSVELGMTGNLSSIIVDHLLHGEDEQAIALLKSLPPDHARQVLGMDSTDFRHFVEKARDPETGVQYLHDTIPAIAAGASNYLDATHAYVWYLAFGALDEYYDVIYKMDEVDTSWTNSDFLTYIGRAYKASGYTAHPRFTPLRNRWGMLDLWEERGPPDDCSKIDGSWVCE
jgi:tetratricopeptide (TPR) repeat protein